MNRWPALLLALLLVGCDDPMSDLASCEADAYRYKRPGSNAIDEARFISNCMTSRGYEYRSEDDQCNLYRYISLMPSCFEQRGLWRRSKLELQKRFPRQSVPAK